VQLLNLNKAAVICLRPEGSVLDKEARVWKFQYGVVFLSYLLLECLLLPQHGHLHVFLLVLLQVPWHLLVAGELDLFWLALKPNHRIGGGRPVRTLIGIEASKNLATGALNFLNNPQEPILKAERERERDTSNGDYSVDWLKSEAFESERDDAPTTKCQAD
jgi:hypothetical protein